MSRIAADRWTRDFLKRRLLNIHKAFELVGIHVLPIHYYSALPSLRRLRHTQDTWAKRSMLTGVKYDLSEFEALLRQVAVPYRSEYKGLPVWHHATSTAAGPGYGYVESQCLHAIIRYFAPRRIVEVGSGVSTAVMLGAIERNAQKTHLTCIEPHPSRWLAGNSMVELLVQPVQTADMGVFLALGTNDLLFIDSSHAVKPGGDVNYLILEVLPRLHRGVIVHFHDIYFPYDYSREVLETFFPWEETSLLHAFLINNTSAKLLLSLGMMHYDCPSVLRETFPEYVPEPQNKGMRCGSAKAMASSVDEHFPSSTYILTV